jgi:phenylalanyl-tRNA synthetase beta subunit
MWVGKCFFNKVLYDDNIRHINDIIEEDGILFNYEKFCATYPSVKINCLDYASITHSIKTWIKKSSIDSKL